MNGNFSIEQIDFRLVIWRSFGINTDCHNIGLQGRPFFSQSAENLLPFLVWNVYICYWVENLFYLNIGSVVDYYKKNWSKKNLSVDDSTWMEMKFM